MELCECPPGYHGTSCEGCSVGYFRESEGPFGPICAPCDCHGHKEICHPLTGECVRLRPIDPSLVPIDPEDDPEDPDALVPNSTDLLTKEILHFPHFFQDLSIIEYCHFRPDLCVIDDTEEVIERT